MKITIDNIKDMVNSTLQILFEGVDYSFNNDNGSVDFSINQDKTDKGNISGGLSVDTRVFGKKNDILNGDGTARAKGLQTNVETAQASLAFYKEILSLARANNIQGIQQFVRKSEKVPNLKNAVNTVRGWLSDKKDIEYIISNASRHIEGCEDTINIYGSTFNRVMNSTESDKKTSRYISGIVPNSDVKFVSLFSMKDFNFSDAIKHIKLRPNGNTDKLMGITKKSRPKEKIPVTYDGGRHTTVGQNFSLDRVRPWHFKQQYQLKGGKYNTSEFGADDLQRELSKSKYTTVNQFLDKSIIYASYVLKLENFRPDFIVAAPSSSKYNDFYCKNLSQKIGVPYIPDFFIRNVLNVKCDDGYAEKMKAEGLSDKDIEDLENGVRGAVIREVLFYTYQPIKWFIQKYANIFKSIKNPKTGQTIPLTDVEEIILKHTFGVLKDTFDNSGRATKLQKELMSIFLSITKYDKDYGSTRAIISNIYNLLRDKHFLKEFKQAIAASVNILNRFSGLLKTRGYRLGDFNKGEPYKITGFSKRQRPYIKHFYVVHNDHLVNGELPTRYKNAKFLIFDEDMNSGATLKLSIDALRDKLPQLPSTDILCLVNGYSAGGM